MTLKLEYVASGTAHTRLNSKKVMQDEAILENTKRMFSKVNSSFGHNFSILYNAFTEEKFGSAYQIFKDCIYNLHADSGGLQIVTQGKSVTPEIKKQIYRTQALYSDVAMCFDIIPVVQGKVTKRHEIMSRVFDRSKLVECARETGKNINEQIKIFRELQSAAKPLVIAQGNCRETYRIWTEVVMAEIDDGNKPFIGGLALGAPAFGRGTLEDIERTGLAAELMPIVGTNYFHILGVGSLQRLLPLCTFLQSGLFKDIHVSYDSSTHTMGLSNGYFFKDTGFMKFDRPYSREYEVAYDDMKKYFGDLIPGLDKGPVHVHKILNSNTTYITNRDKEVEFYAVTMAFVLMSVMNFTEAVEKCATQEKSLLEIARKYKLARDMFSLKNVHTVDDFHYWCSSVGTSIKSSRVATKTSSLSNFW